MIPPFQLTPQILKQTNQITALLTTIELRHYDRPSPILRKQNNIRSIQSSLYIEGNSLSEDQITFILNGKRVMGPAKDILEVENALQVYEHWNRWDPFSERSLLEAHAMLMKELVQSPGQYRSHGVGVVKGEEVIHMAPPAKLVPQLMADLFKYLNDPENMTLISSCVFHYEFEFIHPFADGNGRMGRLWQTLILASEHPVFGAIPLESIIAQRQKLYYDTLEICDKKGESTDFIVFMLEVIETALEEYIQEQTKNKSQEERVRYFMLGDHRRFQRIDYLREFPELSSATASRDLKYAVEKGLIQKTGDKRLTEYQIKR
jgi:Fic family protein